MEKDTNSKKKPLKAYLAVALAAVFVMSFFGFCAQKSRSPLVGKWGWSYDNPELGVKGSVTYTFTKERYFFYESRATIEGHDMSLQVSGTYKTENGFLELDGEVARMFTDGTPEQSETPQKSVDVFKYKVTDKGLELSSDGRTLKLEKTK